MQPRGEESDSTPNSVHSSLVKNKWESSKSIDEAACEDQTIAIIYLLEQADKDATTAVGHNCHSYDTDPPTPCKQRQADLKAIITDLAGTKVNQAIARAKTIFLENTQREREAQGLEAVEWVTTSAVALIGHSIEFWFSAHLQSHAHCFQRRNCIEGFLDRSLHLQIAVAETRLPSCFRKTEVGFDETRDAEGERANCLRGRKEQYHGPVEPGREGSECCRGTSCYDL